MSNYLLQLRQELNETGREIQQAMKHAQAESIANEAQKLVDVSIQNTVQLDKVYIARLAKAEQNLKNAQGQAKRAISNKIKRDMAKRSHNEKIRLQKQEKAAKKNG